MKKIMSDCTCNFWSSDAAEITDPNIVYDKIIKNFDAFCNDGGEILSYWEDDVNISSITIMAHKDYGICLTHDIYYKKLIHRKKEKKLFRSKEEFITSFTHLAVYDKTKLDEVIDVDDELYTSVGLMLPPELAWKGISEFIRTGRMSLELEWITTDVIPESGNWC